ncbi:MAG: hypothetical protein ACWGQW_00010 [bacterium]
MTKIIRTYTLQVEIEVTNAQEYEYQSSYKLTSKDNTWEGQDTDSYIDDLFAQLTDNLRDDMEGELDDLFTEMQETEDSLNDC